MKSTYQAGAMSHKDDRQAEKEQLAIFCGIGRILTSSLNPGEVFRRVMRLIGEHFSPRNWSLLLIEQGSGRLRFEIAMGIDAERLKDFRLEPGEGIVGWVCEHGEPLVVPDVQGHPRFSPRLDQHLGFVTRSVVCVPLLNGTNKVIGAIELINKIRPATDAQGRPTTSEGEPFTELDMAILSSIASFTGIAAENAFLHEKVRELAMVDSLTGLSNRHYFNEVYRREVRRVQRYGHSVCVLMMDVDDLKRVNDNHGHLVGDKVLTILAGILKDSVRQSDVVARVGGDEFVILMPMADEASGREVARRIAERIETWNGKSLLPGVRLGLSIGIRAAGPENVERLLLNADQELYQSKDLKKKPEELTSAEQMRDYLSRTLAGDD
ncbi:MAG: sensor domain-containing diguanylate cyclase [Desulfobacteraceae bacterium]|nr:sensor domain-containing diguanylate cyclase [Desulfobacteraceae bacterium]